ncbi:hypothetical protein [Streptomyces sp. NPDC001642]|uniref:hypothetical protein n=1 Tax=Streptomyces sp. NPDC001642 TaxID=3154392 RepID=UPI00331CD63C
MRALAEDALRVGTDFDGTERNMETQVLFGITAACDASSKKAVNGSHRPSWKGGKFLLRRNFGTAANARRISEAAGRPYADQMVLSAVNRTKLEIKHCSLPVAAQSSLQMDTIPTAPSNEIYPAAWKSQPVDHQRFYIVFRSTYPNNTFPDQTRHEPERSMSIDTIGIRCPIRLPIISDCGPMTVFGTTEDTGLAPVPVS